MVDALQQLAVARFCPINGYDDPVAGVISANNVGGVMVKGSLAVGLPEEAYLEIHPL